MKQERDYFCVKINNEIEHNQVVKWCKKNGIEPSCGFEYIEALHYLNINYKFSRDSFNSTHLPILPFPEFKEKYLKEEKKSEKEVIGIYKNVDVTINKGEVWVEQKETKPMFSDLKIENIIDNKLYLKVQSCNLDCLIKDQLNQSQQEAAKYRTKNQSQKNEITLLLKDKEGLKESIRLYDKSNTGLIQENKTYKYMIDDLTAKNQQLSTELYTIKTIKNFDNKAIENLEINQLQNDLDKANKSNKSLNSELIRVLDLNEKYLKTLFNRAVKIENQRKELKRLNFEYEKAKEFVQNVKPKDKEKKQVFQQRFECVLHPLKCEHLKNDFCLNKKECWAKIP